MKWAKDALTVATSALSGDGVGASVSELVKGVTPPFDEGTVGIHTLPLGAADVVAPAEVQTIVASVSGGGDLGGYFYIYCDGNASEPIYTTASAAEMKALLESVPTLGSVDVTREQLVQSTVEPVAEFGVAWHVTFTSARQAGDAPSLLAYTGHAGASGVSGVASTGTLTGTGATVTVTEATKGALATSYATPATLAEIGRAHV